MTDKDHKAIALEMAFTALAVATGATTPAAGARRVMDLAVDLIPVEDLKLFLSEQDRTFADLTVDVAEAIKLDHEP